MKRQKDYTFKEFSIEVDGCEYTVNIKVWFSFIIRDMGIITESLGQVLTDSKRDVFEIEDIYIEKCTFKSKSGILEDLEDWEHEKLFEDIEKLIKKDYTQYFSLD